jgi:transposase-like protein
MGFMRAAPEGAPNMLMQLEAENSAGGAFNGARRRQLGTNAGSVQLAIPKLREGSYCPSFLEPRRNVGKALLSVIQEGCINGVSARKAEKLV